MKNPYHYLSFVDTTIPYSEENDYPGGPRWAGACFVPGETLMEAVENAWAMGCNPGGEVQAFGPIPGDTVPPKYRHRLLGHKELDALGFQT